jgi:D-glycero-D-manno-heptose 1,7-bisphosphate phosphatase
VTTSADVKRDAVKTVFLDRDGVINRKKDDDYVKSWAEFEFLPGAKAALGLLSKSGYRVIIATNQRGIARGLMTPDDLTDIHRRMQEELAEAGAVITAIYYCPHDSGQCICRKPETGLFLQARRDFPDIDFARSILIGDSSSDMEAGDRLGCRNILVGRDARYESAATLYDAVVMYLDVRP